MDSRRSPLEALLDNVNVEAMVEIPSPEEIQERLPLTDRAAETILAGRSAIRAILDRKDPRLFVVVGPCSIHDPAAALAYAEKLAVERRKHAGEIELLMRVYFEKPRTTVGWKGLINDPRLDGSFAINDGLRQARRLLLELAELGLPAGCEFLDPISPQFTSDLVSWGAIGARNPDAMVFARHDGGEDVLVVAERLPVPPFLVLDGGDALPLDRLCQDDRGPLTGSSCLLERLEERRMIMSVHDDRVPPKARPARPQFLRVVLVHRRTGLAEPVHVEDRTEVVEPIALGELHRRIAEAMCRIHADDPDRRHSELLREFEAAHHCAPLWNDPQRLPT